MTAMDPLERLLESYRENALSERDKGTAFEKLIAAWLVADPVHSLRFRKVEPYGDWARRQDRDRTDSGIDLVATRHDGGLAAIQCKFFEAARKIMKRDIDSFFSASGKTGFCERMVVETTDVPWSPPAETMLHGQLIPTTRIGLRDLQDSPVDWSAFAATGKIGRPPKKILRPDQVEALEAVQAGFDTADRGKMIMACGTGKTLTALRIAEAIAGPGGHVLLLVPSLALMAQTVREWCADSEVPLTAFAACSDTQVGKRRRSRNDVAELQVTDLALPATTNAAQLAAAVLAAASESMRVVFATYQSISVIETAQASHDLPAFELIVCDEAHRTTGVTFAGEDHSNFVKVHDNDVVRGRKRLYMTATPRIYGENARARARHEDAVLASMDDSEIYGEVLFHHGFARAVESGILSDYRVIVLAMDEGQVSSALQRRLSTADSELVLDFATKIVGCWKALSKVGLESVAPPPDHARSPEPMHRALAFCNSIKGSKLLRDEFGEVVSEYRKESAEGDLAELLCEIDHVDGTFNARDRGKRLDWLKEEPDRNVCRILSNARCLTEGVDVPALDAILFLHPRNSQIDVVQAVGRVMRRASGKKMGYVILPVGIPPGVAADQALNDNKRYRVVWQILNALRAHDERLDAVINQGGLGQDVSDRIVVMGLTDAAELEAVTATIDDLPSRSRGGENGTGPSNGNGTGGFQPRALIIDDFSRAVMAKIVEKCGRREYWEDWAKDIARIAERHITRISTLVSQPDSDARKFFQDFLLEVRDDLNEGIAELDVIEMLAQHLITRPVFEVLFEGNKFVDRNPVSAAMSAILSVIDEAQIEREARELEGFYASVRRRAAGIDNPVARQNLIVELYDKFFRGAFPRTTRMLGIVYTPVEIVDFINRSVNDVLRDEFGEGLASEGVHILDPFTGTGTFITRLLQSSLIPPEALERKYRHEIHANELVLLAYYIAAINIETVFHKVAGREEYLPFAGICLTDTFALNERDDELSYYMEDNSDRRELQKKADIQVIIGNPPWRVGKGQNYPGLYKRITDTYAARSQATNKNSLYDSYKLAIRWASDRIGDRGVIGMVTNGSWLSGNVDAGIRASVVEEFSSVFAVNLRGHTWKGGELGRAEGQPVFGIGSSATVAIVILVNNPNAEHKGCRIRYRDIGDYLTREEKFSILREAGSLSGIKDWQEIKPDRHNDWVHQREVGFDRLLPLGSKAAKQGASDGTVFKLYSRGCASSRDAYLYSYSRQDCSQNARRMIEDYSAAFAELGEVPTLAEARKAAARHSSRCHWERELTKKLQRRIEVSHTPENIRKAQYRPFVKQHCYADYELVSMKYQMDGIFPTAETDNRAICVPGIGSTKPFSALMVDTMPDLHFMSFGQCFPRYRFEDPLASKPGGADNPRLLDDNPPEPHRVDNITDQALERFRAYYPDPDIDKDAVFDYVYGIVHAPDFRAAYPNALAKELAAVPLARQFEVFRNAGRKLADLHLGYESCPEYPLDLVFTGQGMPLPKHYRLGHKAMRFAGKRNDPDRSELIINGRIRLRGIPETAHAYVVNGRSPLEWFIDRYKVKTDTRSGIVNDPNAWFDRPEDVVAAIRRIVHVSVETMSIVDSLPATQQTPGQD